VVLRLSLVVALVAVDKAWLRMRRKEDQEQLSDFL